MFEAHSLLDFWLHPQLSYSSFTSSLIDTTNTEVLEYSFHCKVDFGLLETRYLFVSQLTFG